MSSWRCQAGHAFRRRPAAQAPAPAAGPISELRVRAELLGGDLVLSGQIDLILGLSDAIDPTRATRLAVDLKTGGAYPEFAEDMRFYALVMTLRFGVPPYRAASLFLESGTWQSENVTESLLHHAADRVIGAARAAVGLVNGREPPCARHYCVWCPGLDLSVASSAAETAHRSPAEPPTPSVRSSC